MKRIFSRLNEKKEAEMRKMSKMSSAELCAYTLGVEYEDPNSPDFDTNIQLKSLELIHSTDTNKLEDPIAFLDNAIDVALATTQNAPLPDQLCLEPGFWKARRYSLNDIKQEEKKQEPSQRRNSFG